MSKEKTLDKNPYSKNDGKHRYKVIAAIMGFIFNFFGVNRLCMGKYDFYRYFLIGCILSFVGGILFDYYDAFDLAIYLAYIESGIYLCISDKRFNMLCQAKKLSVENKILFMDYKKLDDYAREIGMEIPTAEPIKADTVIERAIKSNITSDQISIEVVERNEDTKPVRENDTVKDNYIDNHGIDGKDINDHEHIKEDKYLKKEINTSQDRLERYKSNDYFPSVDYEPKVNKKQKIKELKEELKCGLITKEEYFDEISKL